MVSCVSAESGEDQLQLTSCGLDWQIAGVMRSEGYTVSECGGKAGRHSSSPHWESVRSRLDNASVK